MATKTTLPGYLRLEQAAELLDVSHSTVWRYIDIGLLNSLQFGNTHLVKEVDVKNLERPPLGRPPIRRRKRGE